MKIIGLATLIVFSFGLVLHAQSTQVEVFYNKERDQAYYIHVVQMKETLYGLSKTYGTRVETIRDINQLASNQLRPGQAITIPFDNSVLIYDNTLNESDYIAVVYQVQKRETVFRICRSYFHVNLTAVKELNSLKRNVLKNEQLLTIGYLKGYQPQSNQLAATGIDYRKSERALAIDPVIEEPAAAQTETPEDAEIEITKIDEDESILYSLNDESGAAYWNKGASGLNGYYVLHRTASPNTWIEVVNPMYETSVRARVIGNIPEGSYPDDVLVIVSPSIAKDLGALDERFYVKVRYLRAESKMTKGK